MTTTNTDPVIKVDDNLVEISASGREYRINVTPEGSLMVYSTDHLALCPHTVYSVETIATDHRVRRLAKRSR